ncbi:hypothetical protein D9M69_446030 [compost metagenome]
MVKVLPRGEVIDCGKPAATPPLIKLIAPMLRLVSPSGALMVKVPLRVSETSFLAEPSARLASLTVRSPFCSDRPTKVTGLFGTCGGTTGASSATAMSGLTLRRSSGNSGMPLNPAVGKPMTGSTRPPTSSSMTKLWPLPGMPPGTPVVMAGPAAVASAVWVGSSPAAMAFCSCSTSVSCASLGVTASGESIWGI